MADCTPYNPHSFILSMDNENGTEFDYMDSEQCCLKVSFDILIQYNCDNLINCSSGGDILDIFNNINLSSNLTYEDIGEPNPVTFYDDNFLTIGDFAGYISGNTNTGLLLSGGDCTSVMNTIQSELGGDCIHLNETTFDSDWLHVEYTICNEAIISEIKGKDIKFGIKEGECSCNHSILLDNIVMEKQCSETRVDNRLINSCPGFDLTREIDNKKSWVSSETNASRDYELDSRDTHYDVNTERLVLNTKELDLNLDGSNTIECAVMDYFQSDKCGMSYTKPHECLEYKTVIETIVTKSDPIFLGPGGSINPGDQNGAHGLLGVRFYDEITDLPLVYRSSFPVSSNVEYQSGGTQTLGLQIPPVTSTFWGTTNLVTIDGRLNEIGVAAAPIGRAFWNGFSVCITAKEGELFHIGVAANNNTRFYINGDLRVNLTNNIDRNHQIWHVFPIRLIEGDNLIEMFGKNDDSFNDTNFGAEIYSGTTVAELSGATNESDAHVIWNTAQKQGQLFDIGETIGYQCPEGSALSLCGEPECLDFETVETEVCVVSTGGWSINDLLTTNMETITDVQSFIEVIRAELVDVKNRKVLQSYPTIKYLYERYLGLISSACAPAINNYTYCDLNTFTNLVNKYWYELFEQVVPTTAIWGATTTYRNTVFDQAKFQYKKYGVLTCDNTEPCPHVETSGDTINIDYRRYSVNVSGGSEYEGTINTCDPIPAPYESCVGLNIQHMDYLSSFIGKISTTMSPGGPNNIITEEP